MTPLPHQYDVWLRGGPSGYADAWAPGMPALRTAPPVTYGGPGDAWSPEHLLLASVQACFLFTFRAVARLSKVEFVELEVEAAGTVDRQEAVTRFTEIVLRAKVVVPSGADRTRTLGVLEKAKRACLVSNSLLTQIQLEPQFLEAEMPAGSPARG